MGILKNALLYATICLAGFALVGCDLDGEGLKWGTAVAGDETPDFPDDGGNGGEDPGDGGNG
ncbi:MAG: hypothetical protein KJ060_09245, partial [Candidatus Hydrogenedentes bacterium]|nr:hypothetical protein [Candidatus Hydrogenedentota bacterium]